MLKSNYEKSKQAFKNKVIEEVRAMTKKSLSWGDIATYQRKIYKKAKYYGLIKEFKENGIL